MPTSHAIGRKGEAAARVYLEMRGYRILETNFRRPRCEIDIVASKDDTVYFVEVKYRRNDDQGGGFEAVTATKVRRMAYAAETWVEEYKWRGPYQLAVVELEGPQFAVIGFIDNLGW